MSFRKLNFLTLFLPLKEQNNFYDYFHPLAHSRTSSPIIYRAHAFVSVGISCQVIRAHGAIAKAAHEVYLCSGSASLEGRFPSHDEISSSLFPQFVHKSKRKVSLCEFCFCAIPLRT